MRLRMMNLELPVGNQLQGEWGTKDAGNQPLGWSWQRKDAIADYHFRVSGEISIAYDIS